MENSKYDFPAINYREPFICPYHKCTTDNGWCWECAVETYGYDNAKLVHDNNMDINKAKKIHG